MAAPRIVKEVLESPSVPSTLNKTFNSGLQVLSDVPRITPFKMLSMRGKTLINLLGKQGKDVSKWVSYAGSTISYDTTNKLYGTNAIKAVFTTTSGGLSKNILGNLKSNLHYLAVAEVKNETSTGVRIQIDQATSTADGNSTSSNVFATIYRTFQLTGTGCVMYIYTSSGASGHTFYADGMRVFQITSSEKTYIDGLTVAAAQAYIAANYPYVESVQHLNAPYIIKYGENLISPVNEWTLSVDHRAISPYRLEIKSTTPSLLSEYFLPSGVYDNMTFRVKATFNGRFAVHYRNESKEITSYAVNYSDNGSERMINETFTCPVGTRNISITFHNGDDIVNTKYLINPMISVGTRDIPFKPREDNHLYIDGKFASSENGDVYDSLYVQDGKLFRKNRFQKDLVIDGSLNWTFGADRAGYKQVVCTLPTPNGNGIAVTDAGVLVKNDGTINYRITGGTADSAADQMKLYADRLYLHIADADSGWGESYTPTSDEIKAYFYGWYMKNLSGEIYASGTKRWQAVWSTGQNWSPLADNEFNKGVAPTYKAPMGYTPYTLFYQLNVPTTEEVQFEGGITLHEGDNLIEVGSGVVVREKISTVLVGTDRHFARSDSTASQLTQRPLKVLQIFKNQKLDLRWIKLAGSSVNQGEERGWIPSLFFDPTALYQSTYTVLDKHSFTSSATPITGEYDVNTRTIVDSLSEFQANASQGISANEIGVKSIWADMNNIKSDLYAPMTKVRILNNATQNINAATLTKVLFQYATQDVLTEFDNTFNSKITVKKAGVYDFKGAIIFSSGVTAANVISIILFKNGGGLRTILRINGGASATPLISFADTVELAAYDYVEIYIQTSVATVLAADSNIYLTRIL